MVILLTFNKPKKPNSKISIRETGYLCIFLIRPLRLVTGAPPWLLRPMMVSTSSELYPDTQLFFFFFFNAKASSFLILCRTCVTCGAPWYAGGLRVLFIPREAEDFPGGDNHSNHVPLPTNLA